jgi:Zn2+/Cd2+-exporting ATPase
MKNEGCLIEEMARVMQEDPALKAITLDSERKRVSYALQVGGRVYNTTEDDATLRELQALVNEYAADKIPACVERQGYVACEVCQHKHTLKLPSGIRIMPMPGAVLLQKDSCVTAPLFWKWTQIPWLKFQVRAADLNEAEHEDWRHAMVLALVCLVATIAGFVLKAHGLANLSIVAFLSAYVSGAWHPAEEVFDLFRKRILDVHFLMLAVAVGAAFIGHWSEGAILLFLFSFSGALESYAMHRTQRAISSLFHEAPKEAMVVRRDGSEESIPVSHIAPGLTLRIRPGEQFPVDAVITSGATAADESNLTGEAMPVDKHPGDTVLSGTLNTWGRIDCRVLRPASESALNKIITLIKDAQASKAPAQRFTDKFGTQYTYAILGLSTVMFFIWWLLAGLPAFDAPEGQRSAFYNAMTLLVVGSPCALVLSIPSAILAGIAAGARRGVLFRGGSAIEKLAEIKRVAFDKTGTLTTGELSLERIESFPPGREDEVLRLALSLAANSNHPVSRAVSIVAKERAITPLEVEGFHSITGQGIAGTLKAAFADCNPYTDIILGRRSVHGDWVQAIPEAAVGVTESFLEAGPVRGRILLRDRVRFSSKALLEKLAENGLHVTMLTGDRHEAARAVAEQVGLKDFRAGLNPEQKVAAIEEWNAQGEKVAMIGDGVNDAPSLAAAYVGVGMGIRGSDAALEQADVVLMQDRLENFYYAFRLSHRARRIIYQNLFIALGVVVLLVFSAIGAFLPLTLGVFGHEGSTVLVVLNSLRLLLPE